MSKSKVKGKHEACGQAVERKDIGLMTYAEVDSGGKMQYTRERIHCLQVV